MSFHIEHVTNIGVLKRGNGYLLSHVGGLQTLLLHNTIIFFLTELKLEELFKI